MLGCDGVEVCLFDKQTKSYRQSITAGQPFSSPIEELSSIGAAGSYSERYSPEKICIEGIRFAGQMIGVLRASFATTPSEAKKNAFKLYAQQVSLIVTNSDFIVEIQKARRLQDDSLRAKTGFLANLSHELRGPLGVILNATEILHEGMNGPVNDSQKEMLQMVLSNGEHLLELLNDVLDYARVEAGKVQPKKIPIAIPEILHELAQIIQVQALQKKQRVSVSATMEGQILCDRKHFRQILINLLTNAVKYTPESGSIQISAERQSGGTCKITVADTGCGIKKADFPKVFNAFERIAHGYAAEQAGTGLGLSLTKRLVEMNGGFIDFISTPSQGSAFFITFPEHIKDEDIEIEQKTRGELNATDKSDAPPALIPSLSPVRIALIGKPTEEVKIFSEYLRAQSFQIIAFETVEHLQNHPDGLTVLVVDESAKSFLSDDPFNQIRKSLSGYSLPLVYLSRDAFTFSVEEQLRMGVDRFIAKPVALQDLVQQISQVSATH